jgi:hypothetical protein
MLLYILLYTSADRSVFLQHLLCVVNHRGVHELKSSHTQHIITIVQTVYLLGMEVVL